MIEIKFCAGKCVCGKRLDMRLADIVGEDNEIFAWEIHGFCKKCQKVYVQQLFLQEEEPVEDRDFVIEWDKIVEVSNHESKQNR